MSIKLAFSRPTASLEEQTELFGRYREAGYDGLQLKGGQYAAYVDQPDLFKERWGNPPGIGSALVAGGRLDSEGVDRLRGIFRFASGIGTERIVYCHGLSRAGVTADDLRGYADLLSELGKEAQQQYGVRLSLHHHYDNPVMYREDFDVFYERVRDQAVGLTVDTAHLVKSGIHDAAEVIRSFGSVIDNFHLKDFSQGEWRVLGQGDIDFAPIFGAIGHIGYTGWISADEESGDGIREGMESCYRFIRRGLQTPGLS